MPKTWIEGILISQFGIQIILILQFGILVVRLNYSLPLLFLICILGVLEIFLIDQWWHNKNDDGA